MNNTNNLAEMLFQQDWGNWDRALLKAPQSTAGLARKQMCLKYAPGKDLKHVSSNR